MESKYAIATDTFDIYYMNIYYNNNINYQIFLLRVFINLKYIKRRG